MKHFLFLIFLSALLSSCITRYETDAYTITVRDSLIRENVHNAPGTGGDNGTIFPSSRTTRLTRESLSYDSTYERQYPAFLRYGGIEFAGMITGSSNPGIGAGLFGVYTLLDSNHNLLKHILEKTPENSIFKGRLFRVMPVEYQLHWFNEAPDWTIGWSAYESIAKDDDGSNSLYSVGSNVYIRKRYWFRDKAPYLFASPYFGVSVLPSFYVNLGSELTFGSYGGFNLRAYAGLATGFTIKSFLPTGQDAKSITTPYIGFGVSALDFINKVSETQHEWKDYLHSAVEVSFLDFDLLDAFANYPNLFQIPGSVPITGANIQLATSHFPLDIFDGKFWAGTSLMKFFALGYNQAVLSVLPLRFGYRQYLIAQDLTLEPFLEMNYYPSSFVNLAARLRLNTFHDITFGIIFGYAYGSTGAFYNKLLIQQGSAIQGSISSFYLGLSFSPKDRLNTPEFVHALEKLVTW
jgi:hypothetical protein